MNQTVQDIINRRSVKIYKPEQVTDEELDLVLQAGLNAPSGGNRQPVICIAVQNKELRDKLSTLNGQIAGAPEGFDVFYGAPTVILVGADKNAPDGVRDGSLALGNMFNAAYAMGLGSRWINRVDKMFEYDLVKDLLEQVGYDRDGYIGVGSCILGYPKEGFPEPIPRKENRVKIVK